MVGLIEDEAHITDARLQGREGDAILLLGEACGDELGGSQFCGHRPRPQGRVCRHA